MGWAGKGDVPLLGKRGNVLPPLEKLGAQEERDVL